MKYGSMLLAFGAAACAHAGNGYAEPPPLAVFVEAYDAGDSKTIAGADDRVDLYAVQDPRIAVWADSVCALVNESQLVEAGSGEYKLSTSAYTLPLSINGISVTLEACEDEPFGSQPVGAFCTGFAVGEDVIATAGHCVSDAFNLKDVRFLFGFRMKNATEAATRFDASQIYSAVEILSGANDISAADFALIRLDRPITARGAVPLPLRQSGQVSVGTRVGMIGHPNGLPAKATFGGSMVTENDEEDLYFISDIDTFGGNSGSPVFNTSTGLVEGVMVRRSPTNDRLPAVRAPGFGLRFCFESTVLGEGEELRAESTRSTAIDLAVHRGQLALDKPAYRCEDSVLVRLADDDLAGKGIALVTVLSGSGDAESILLPELADPGRFEGAIAVGAGEVTPNSGVIESVDGELIVFAYDDEDTGAGAHVITATARIDCVPPAITVVTVEAVSGAAARVAVNTDEMASATVGAGLACREPASEGTGALALTHAITVGALKPLTRYYAYVEATDVAGNRAFFDNDGACVGFSTTAEQDYLAQDLRATPSRLQGYSLTLTPDNSTSGYRASASRRTTFPTSPGCGQSLEFRDDSSARVNLNSRSLPFFGLDYDHFFINSNGNITFGEADASAVPEPEVHFRLPRIAPLFLDLHPETGGLIELVRRSDGIAVTYDNVPDSDGIPQRVQAELFYDGVIRLTWLRVRSTVGMVGLSDGLGEPLGFLSTDLAAYPESKQPAHPDAPCEPEMDLLACHGPAQRGHARTIYPLSANVLVLVLLGIAIRLNLGRTTHR